MSSIHMRETQWYQRPYVGSNMVHSETELNAAIELVLMLFEAHFIQLS
jgi:hypothetical protein